MAVLERYGPVGGELLGALCLGALGQLWTGRGCFGWERIGGARLVGQLGFVLDRRVVERGGLDWRGLDGLGRWGLVDLGEASCGLGRQVRRVMARWDRFGIIWAWEQVGRQITNPG